MQRDEAGDGAAEVAVGDRPVAARVAQERRCIALDPAELRLDRGGQYTGHAPPPRPEADVGDRPEVEVRRADIGPHVLVVDGPVAQIGLRGDVDLAGHGRCILAAPGDGAANPSPGRLPVPLSGRFAFRTGSHSFNADEPVAVIQSLPVVASFHGLAGRWLVRGKS